MFAELHKTIGEGSLHVYIHKNTKYMYKDTPIAFSNSMLRPFYRLQIHTFLHHLPQWTEKKNAQKCINTNVHLELRIKNPTHL